MLSEIVSVFASQKTFLPDQYDCAAIMQATECANPSCTVAWGCWRERMHSNQFAMCSVVRSSMPKRRKLGLARQEHKLGFSLLVDVGVVFVRSFFFDHLITRAAFAAIVDQSSPSFPCSA